MCYFESVSLKRKATRGMNRNLSCKIVSDIGDLYKVAQNCCLSEF